MELATHAETYNDLYVKNLPRSERLVCGEKIMCYHTKDFTPGCRVKTYIDGECGTIESTFYKIIEDENGTHMKLSVGVKWDESERELYAHATLAAACVIIEVPADYKAHLDDMKERRERLAEQYGITFKNFRDE
jgi:hypothetical protein